MPAVVDPRARPARKWCLVVVRPRPGRPLGTLAATRRSTSESLGSPSRISMRVPSTSRIWLRKSIQRELVTMTCTPKVRPAPGELLDLRLELVELGAHGRPAVDDEEDVAVAVVDPARRPAAAVGLDRVDAVRAEVALAGVDDAAHLGDEPAHDLGLAAVGDPGDVGELGQRGEGAAAEVEHVELALERRGRQRDRR